MLLAPRRSLGLALLFYSFVEDTFPQERGSNKGYLLFFLYFSSCSTYSYKILAIDHHHYIDILSTVIGLECELTLTIPLNQGFSVHFQNGRFVRPRQMGLFNRHTAPNGERNKMRMKGVGIVLTHMAEGPET